MAVAHVVINRVNSGKFPNSVCGVVKQKNQFSWYPKKPMNNSKADLAEQVLKGIHKNRVPKALFFTNLSVRFKRRVLEVIGKHRFYG